MCVKIVRNKDDDEIAIYISHVYLNLLHFSCYVNDYNLFIIFYIDVYVW